MRLAQNVKGISKLILLLLFVMVFIIGATISYVWTMGFYVSSEFNNSKHTNVTIENVQFFPGNTSYFNVTVLNQSFSPSNATIEQIKVETADGELHTASTPSLPFQLAKGSSQTFKSFWNWANYTGQTLIINAFVSEGDGSNRRVVTPSIKFNITSVKFDPSVSVNYFNITVQNTGSPTFVNITKILVNGKEVTTSPTLFLKPFTLTNASDAAPVTFMLFRNWIDLQDSQVTVTIQTLQGYQIYKTVKAPPPVVLSITGVNFDATISTNHFNITVLNDANSPTDVEISEVEVSVEDKVFSFGNWSAFSWPGLISTIKLERGKTTLIVIPWIWSSYQGQGKVATITVHTVQGFRATYENKAIP